MTMKAKVKVKLYEFDGWYVVESREYVPAGCYEVRDVNGRRYGIWDSLDAAVRHLHEVHEARDVDIFTGDPI